jgi:hypothetical protein
VTIVISDSLPGITLVGVLRDHVTFGHHLPAPFDGVGEVFEYNPDLRGWEQFVILVCVWTSSRSLPKSSR